MPSAARMIVRPHGRRLRMQYGWASPPARRAGPITGGRFVRAIGAAARTYGRMVTGPDLLLTRGARMDPSAAGQSAPVVDDVGVAGAVARLVGTVHRHALEVPAKAAVGQHPPGAVAAGVRPSDQDRRAAVGGQPMACADEQAEPAFRAGTRPDGTELDVAGAPPASVPAPT